MHRFFVLTGCLPSQSDEATGYGRGRWFDRASRPYRGLLQVGHRHGSLWEDCYGGVFADSLQFLGDRDCYIRDRLEVHAPDVVGGYLAVESDPGPLQNQGEELHLPL